MNNKLIIVGAGDVGKFIAYNINNFGLVFNIEGFVDDDKNKIGTTIAGYKVLGNIDSLNGYSGKGYSLALGIAFPGIKKKVLSRFENLDFSYPSLISKHAWVSENVKIGIGVILYPGVSINYESNIGDFVVMNMNCAIGHNSTIGRYSALAPGVNFGGFTNIGEAVDMGIGSSTIQKIKVGNNSIIGGETMLINDVPDGVTVVGVPGKIKSK